MVVTGNKTLDIDVVAHAIKRIEDDKEDNDGLLEEDNLPFPKEILRARLPRMIKDNLNLKYNGSTDPRTHIRYFLSLMTLYQVLNQATYDTLPSRLP